MKATYTGLTVMAAFSRPKRATLIHGQRVLIVKQGEDTSTVQYDPTDERHLDCELGTNARIRGVPNTDLRIEKTTSPWVKRAQAGTLPAKELNR